MMERHVAAFKEIPWVRRGKQNIAMASETASEAIRRAARGMRLSESCGPLLADDAARDPPSKGVLTV